MKNPIWNCITDNKKFEEIKKETKRIFLPITELDRLDNKNVENLEFSNKEVRRYNNLLLKEGRQLPRYLQRRLETILINEQKYKDGKIPLKKKKRKSNNTKTQHRLYVGSSKWEKRKHDYYLTHERICAVCGSNKKVHLHHKFYSSRGEELDKHLVPLCEFHHSEFHKLIGKVKKDMIKETNTFIKYKGLAI